jgi:hypothetical protein
VVEGRAVTEWALSLLVELLRRLPVGKVVPDRDTGRPYLTRRFLSPYAGRFGRWLRKRLPSAFLHCLHMSDAPKRGLHSHPWPWAVSVILRGGYIEIREDGWRYFRPGDINVIRGDAFHRIELADENEPTWTLFIVGPRHGGWGFKNDKGAFIFADPE